MIRDSTNTQQYSVPVFKHLRRRENHYCNSNSLKHITKHLHKKAKTLLRDKSGISKQQISITMIAITNTQVCDWFAAINKIEKKNENLIYIYACTVLYDIYKYATIIR